MTAREAHDVLDAAKAALKAAAAAERAARMMLILSESADDGDESWQDFVEGHPELEGGDA
jgi:hypothetical protein